MSGPTQKMWNKQKREFWDLVDVILFEIRRIVLLTFGAGIIRFGEFITKWLLADQMYPGGLLRTCYDFVVIGTGMAWFLLIIVHALQIIILVGTFNKKGH